jgi:hypothetical protein
MKKNAFLFLIILFGQSIFAQQNYNLIINNKTSLLYYNGNENVIKTAIDILTNDSKLLCDNPFFITNELKSNTVIIGIPDRESDIKEIAKKFNVETQDLTDKWEAYKIQAIESNGQSLLFVLGSDPRGTAYGILELSRQMGITPWVWWADVVPDKKTEVVIKADGKVYAPSVQYRGIFLNDEDWGLMPWSTRTFEPTLQAGAIGPKTYGKIFELLLRLRANTIWPAMHECTIPFFFVEGNKDMAEKYGIILSTSHAEPMMRTNTGEWDNKYGQFNFFTNKNRVLSYWDERIAQLKNSENIYTIGMRGIHDGRMQGVSSIDEETKILHTIIDEQRIMLKKHNPQKDIASIPQIFVPYKEVLKAYDNGLKLPEDVTLVWCDDNHGYIMRLSDTEEQKRSGGGGVYYHISYWGKPHDYLWLGSTQPGLIYTEMKRAWDNNARRMWILNVGDIKPHEYLTEFFLDMAWDINAFAGDKIYEYQQNWIKTVFKNKASEKINLIMKQYYRLAGQRKPEHMAWNQVEDWDLRTKEPSNRYGLQPVKDSELSLKVFGDEMERRISAYNKIAILSQDVYRNEIPDELKSAYFQLIHYPVAASAAMNRKILYAQKSRYYAEQSDELAGYYARLATDAYNEIASLGYTYNKDLEGKWELMMDMKPRDLPVFQQPVLPKLSNEILLSANKPDLPQVPALVETAGTPVEGDRMIALNAYSYVNDIQFESIESLGHSGKSVRLPAAKSINIKQPHLEYKINTESKGDVKIKIGTIPMHSVNGKSEMRYAVVIDKQKPIIVSTAATFLSDKWAENVLRNQSLTSIDAHIAEPGEHTVRIYSLDEELIVDQLMFDFDLERKHYLIPAFESK